MTDVTSQNGSVVWVSLSTDDVDGAIHFYEQLLGWHYDDFEAGGERYVIARVPEGPVGGMMTLGSAQIAAGVPPSWSVTVRSDRLDAVVAETRNLGGAVLESPTSIPGGARVAVIADPAGAPLALMEMPSSGPSMVWDRPGGVCWVECLSRDPSASRRFYEELLGWKTEEGSGGYVMFFVDGHRFGGLLSMPGSVPAAAPSHWLMYLTVNDVPAICARATELGGRILEPTHEIREGRFAVLQDPAGAVFAVFEPRTE